jgi:hypothetical protein
MTLSFATFGAGNGFTGVQLSFSTDGGTTFSAPQAQVLTQGQETITFVVPPGANNAPNLVLRLQFTGGGQDAANNIQTFVDNIQINGTIIPEPATIAGGLLGVLGLCWQQRRRLIGALRLRRT